MQKDIKYVNSSTKKNNSRFIVPRLQGGGGSVGIWGCITYHGPGLSLLYNGRMNQYNYIETLENTLIPTRDIFFSGDDQWVFQQLCIENKGGHIPY